MECHPTRLQKLSPQQFNHHLLHSMRSIRHLHYQRIRLFLQHFLQQQLRVLPQPTQTLQHLPQHLLQGLLRSPLPSSHEILHP